MQEHVFKRKRKINGKLVLSHCYYGHYTLPNDTRQRTVVLNTTDKQQAQSMLRKIVQDAAWEASGITAPKPAPGCGGKAVDGPSGRFSG